MGVATKIYRKKWPVETDSGTVWMTYDDYLRSDSWKDRRETWIRLWDYRCAICNGLSKLCIHHRSYQRLGEELPTDVIVLCRDCHEIFHEHGSLDMEVV